MMAFITSPVVAMIVMLGGLVLFHELGHYIAGRLCGVAVEAFRAHDEPGADGHLAQRTPWRCA